MNPIEQIHEMLVKEELITDSEFNEEKIASAHLFPTIDGRDSMAVWRRGLFTFKNGTQLSVIKGGGAYSSPGTVEIAFFEGQDFSTAFAEEWGGEDVLGYQTPDEVMEWVHRFLSAEKKVGDDGELA